MLRRAEIAQARVRLAREAFQQRRSEARFADARLAREEHYVAFGVLRVRPPPQEQIEFFFAPDKLRQPLAWRASKRLSTEAGRSAAQARIGTAMPLRSFASRSSSSNRLPRSFRVFSAMTTVFGSATPCRRAARFGVSPTTACS